jgi:hypothetical protein
MMRKNIPVRAKVRAAIVAMILAFPYDTRRPPPQPAEHKKHDDRRCRRDQQFGQIVAHPVGD